MTRRLLRIGECCRKLGIKKSTLYERFIRPGKLRMYAHGKRAVVAREEDVDALVAEIANSAPINYAAPLHARNHVGRSSKRTPDALVHDAAGRLVGEAWKVSI
jgi:predicted DNA-binding transcriptional regulator AlpA